MIQRIGPAFGKDVRLYGHPGEMKKIDWNKLSEKWEIAQDVVYSHAGGRTLRLDLYKPKSAAGEKLPGLVFIHGGGWNSGNRKSIPAIFTAVPGYVKISVDYRLAGEASFPAQLRDCKTAVRWMRAHAEELNLDPGRIGVWGSSAGGHLASLLGTTEGIGEYEGEEYREFSSAMA